MVIVCIQQPVAVVFLELRRRHRHYSIGRGEFSDGLPPHCKAFDKYPLTHFVEENVPIDPDSDIFVLPGCAFGDRSVISTSEVQRFEDFTKFHAHGVTKACAKPRAVKVQLPGDERARLLLEYPFLTEEDIKLALRKPRAKRVREGDEVGPVGEPEVPKFDDSDLEVDALDGDGVSEGSEEVPIDEAELASLRADWVKPEEDVMHFYTHLRRAPAADVGRLGVSSSAAAMARGGLAKYWCEAYSWQEKYEFFHSVYGVDGSNALANEVVRRGDFFFKQWLDQDSDHFLYTEANIDAYAEDLEWLNWITSLAADSVSYIRGLEVRRIVQINPDWID